MRCNKFGAKTRCQSCNWASNRLCLLQIERVEAFGEPAVDRSEKIAGLLPLALITPEPRQCSSPRAAPRTLPAAPALLIARARNRLALSPHPAPATSMQFRQPRDELRPRTIFPWLFPRLSSLRRCSAKPPRIAQALHERGPSAAKRMARKLSLPLSARQQSRRSTFRSRPRLCRSVPIREPCIKTFRPPSSTRSLFRPLKWQVLRATALPWRSFRIRYR